MKNLTCLPAILELVACRDYLQSTIGRIAVRQRIRLASFVLDRTRWGLTILALPFPAETLSLWMGRLDPTRTDHDPAVAVRLRMLLDDALRLADTWVGEIARRVPSDGALAVVGDRGLAAELSFRMAHPTSRPTS